MLLLVNLQLMKLHCCQVYLFSLVTRLRRLQRERICVEKRIKLWADRFISVGLLSCPTKNSANLYKFLKTAEEMIDKRVK